MKDSSRLMRYRLAPLILLLVLAGCSGPGAPYQPVAAVEVNVFAAASLIDAFQAIGRRFEAANPHVSVVFNFAGSQQLAQQIVQGAPADVFAAADRRQLAVVAQAGRIAGGAEQVFAHNRLVVIYARDSQAAPRQLHDLARPGVKIDLANEAVPAGRYALEALERAANDPVFGPAFRAAVLQNVVSYEENVRAVVGKVALGEADAGIAYVSDIAGERTGAVGWFPLADSLSPPVAYPIAPISDSPNIALAQQFVAFVLSPDGQAILKEHGFLPRSNNG